MAWMYELSLDNYLDNKLVITNNLPVALFSFKHSLACVDVEGVVSFLMSSIDKYTHT